MNNVLIDPLVNIVPTQSITKKPRKLNPNMTIKVSTINGITKPRCWPVRHMTRCGAYYGLFKMWSKLGVFININKKEISDGSPRTFSEHEIKVITEARDNLMELYKNRFKEYFVIKHEEENEKVKDSFKCKFNNEQ